MKTYAFDLVENGTFTDCGSFKMVNHDVVQQAEINEDPFAALIIKEDGTKEWHRYTHHHDFFVVRELNDIPKTFREYVKHEF